MSDNDELSLIYKREVPDTLKDIYFDFHWSQAKLWALNLESRRVPISDLEWALEFPIWASHPPEKMFDLAPSEVIKSPERFPGHSKRIHNADLGFPIYIMHWNNRWLIMDGFHRLLKTILIGEKEISAFLVPTELIPEIQPDPGQPRDFLKYELARRDQ